jgi:aspartyl-tRNA(Asn)/glutamyl-tRNA(Gln) amidotransferase subunit A
MQEGLLGARTIKQAARLMKGNVFTSPDLIEACYENINNLKRLNGYVSVRPIEEALREAEESQKRIEKNMPLSPIDGVPIAVKDNILTAGMECTASSNILKGFRSPIDSTAVHRLRDAGAIVVGMANMDEMGMGSFGMYGANGTMVRNPIDEDHFCGGSSAGSACVTKSYQCLGSLGTDTGGSVNYPAHCTGLFSMKPSFGRISRFGQILYSSSNETTGPFAHSMNDVHTFFDIMQGKDQHDSSCVDFTKLHTIRDIERVTNREIDSPGILEGLRVGVLDEFNIEELDDRNRNIQELVIQMLKDQGAIIKRMQVPLMKYCLPFYFTLIPSEAATNLQRFDGLKYGAQPDFEEGEDLHEYITRVRSENFGINVKRRAMLGNFLLSSKFEDYNEKVAIAQKVRRMLIEQWNTEMLSKDIDIVISPTTIGEEPTRIADVVGGTKKKNRNPVYEFKMDYFSAFPNSLGIPGVTIPIQETWGRDPKTGLRTSAYKFPGSVKVHALFGEDYHLLRIAKQMEIMVENAGMAAV